MVSPLPLVREALTGRARLRRGRFGALVVEVEVEHTSFEPFLPDRRRRIQVGPNCWEDVRPWRSWRDAVAGDVVLGVPFTVPTEDEVVRLWRERYSSPALGCAAPGCIESATNGGNYCAPHLAERSRGRSEPDAARPWRALIDSLRGTP